MPADFYAVLTFIVSDERIHSCNSHPVNTRRYLDVDPTFFERYGRQNNVVCLLLDPIKLGQLS